MIIEQTDDDDSLPSSGSMLLMNVIRCIVGTGCIGVAAYIVAFNWGCVIVSTRNRKRGINRHHSVVPLGSALFAAFALIAYSSPLRYWVLLVPILDIGNWLLLWLPVVFIRNLRDKKN